MFSDSELHRIEDAIKHSRDLIQRLQREASEIREKEMRDIKRIQNETERDLTMNERHMRDAEREIQRHEQDLSRRRTALEQQFNKEKSKH